jgi:hypothetical protein
VSKRDSWCGGVCKKKGHGREGEKERREKASGSRAKYMTISKKRFYIYKLFSIFNIKKIK